MNEYSWLNHPAIKDIDPAKLAFIISYAESSKGKTSEQMLPLLLQANAGMKAQNLTFTKDEQDLLIDVLSEDMSKEDKNKLDMMKNIIMKNQRK